MIDATSLNMMSLMMLYQAFKLSSSSPIYCSLHKTAPFLSTAKSMFKSHYKLASAILITLFSSSVFAGWGAFAVVDWEGADSDDVGYVQTYDAITESEAISQAMSACRNMQVEEGQKASECRVVVSFQKCGAYSASKKYYGVGSAQLLSVAEKRATQQCGSNSCKIIVSGCNP